MPHQCWIGTDSTLNRAVMAVQSILAIAAFVALVQSGVFASASADGTAAKILFRKRCSACHTFGKGIKVGPDLKGVTDRRKREWLVKFIQSSSTVIQSGDIIAAKLFVEFRRERMPDWSDLSREQVGAIVDYLAANGPEQKEPYERHASTASASEIEAGRQLFQGEKILTYGGTACHICHSLNRMVTRRSTTLGPDLSEAYFRFQDKGLTDFLKRPCILREPERSMPTYLTPQESFELNAFLAKVAGMRIPVPRQAASRTSGKDAEANPQAADRGRP